MKVLVLEGDPEVRISLVDLLEQIGGVTVRAEGRDLVASVSDILNEFQPELVLMSWRDFRQPMLARIKACTPTIPVWVFSAYSRKDIAREAKGAEEIFEKGDHWETDRLIRAISSMRDSCLHG